MKKIDGYIDINDILNSIGITDTSLDNLRCKVKVISMGPNGIVFSFNYHGEQYFYKYNEKIIPYSELIAEELAYDFGLECASYSLAELNGKKGVISHSYNEKNTNYISGSDILLNSYSEKLKLNDSYKEFEIENYNNLEAIWDALEKRYYNNPNRSKIVSKLMYQIINMFIFDIIICNYDRHSDNWKIMESNSEISLAPIYDNEGILITKDDNALVSITLDNKNRSFLWDNLIYFLGVSSDEFSDIIRNKLWIISEENINKIFSKVEAKTGTIISDDYKKYYLEGYNNHRQKLEMYLNTNENKRRR